MVRLAMVGAADLQRPGRELAEEHRPARRRRFDRAAAGRTSAWRLRLCPSPAFAAPSARRHPEPPAHVCEDVFQLLLGALGRPAFGFEAERHVATAAVGAEAQRESPSGLPVADHDFAFRPLWHLTSPRQRRLRDVARTERPSPAVR